MKTAQDFDEITTLRHEMYISNDWDEWIKLLSQINEFCNEIKEIDLPFISDEAVWCNRDDCGMEDCQYCKEREQELLYDNKDKINSIIEEWLTECEEEFKLEENEICPTGVSRDRWINSI